MTAKKELVVKATEEMRLISIELHNMAVNYHEHKARIIRNVLIQCLSNIEFRINSEIPALEKLVALEEESQPSALEAVQKRIDAIRQHEENSKNHHGLTVLYLKNLYNEIQWLLERGEKN